MRLVVEKTFFNVITAEDEEKDKVRTLKRSVSAPTLGSSRDEDEGSADGNNKADISKAPLQPVTAGQSSAGPQQRLRGRMFASESYARLKQRSFASGSTTASKINLQNLFDEDSDGEEHVMGSPSPSPPAIRGLPLKRSAASSASSSAASSVGPGVALAPATAAAANAGMSTTAPSAGQMVGMAVAAATVPPKSVPCPNLVPFPFAHGDAMGTVVTQVVPNLPSPSGPLPFVPPQAFNTTTPVSASVACVPSMTPAPCNGSQLSHSCTSALDPTATGAGPFGPRAGGQGFSSVNDAVAAVANFPSRGSDASSHQYSNLGNQSSSTNGNACISTSPCGGSFAFAGNRANGPNCVNGSAHAVGATSFGPVGSRSPGSLNVDAVGSIEPEAGTLGPPVNGLRGAPFAPGSRRGGLRKMRADLKAAVKRSGISNPMTGMDYFEPVHEDIDEDDEPSHMGMGYSAFGSGMGDTSLGRNPLPVDSYSRGCFGGGSLNDGGHGTCGACGGGACGPVGVAGGSLQCCGGCSPGAPCTGSGRMLGCGSHMASGACAPTPVPFEGDGNRSHFVMIGPLSPEFQLPRITKFHSFHREVRHFGDLSPDGRKFTKRAFENRLSLVCEGTLQTAGRLRYLVQFSGGQLSTADGVGFVFCRKLPCPKDIQQIVSIFLNRHGAICLRAHSELVRLNTRLRPLSLGDWIEVEIDMDNEHATFKLWPCDQDSHAPLVGSFAYAETFIELRNRVPQKQRGGNRARRDLADVASGMDTLPPLDLHCGYLACVVKNLGVSLQLGS